MEVLGESLVLVEGVKDATAIYPYVESVIEASGRTRDACRRASESGAGSAVLLTDLDKRGDELAEELRSELGRYGIKADTETRKRLGGLLCMERIENFKGKYRKALEEIKE